MIVSACVRASSRVRACECTHAQETIESCFVNSGSDSLCNWSLDLVLFPKALAFIFCVRMFSRRLGAIWYTVHATARHCILSPVVCWLVVTGLNNTSRLVPRSVLWKTRCNLLHYSYAASHVVYLLECSGLNNTSRLVPRLVSKQYRVTVRRSAVQRSSTLTRRTNQKFNEN